MSNPRDTALNAILMNILIVLENLTDSVPAAEEILKKDIQYIREDVLKLYKE